MTGNMRIAVVLLALILLLPAGAYFDYARVTPDRLEWMAVAEPLEYQWFYGREVGDGVEWLPVTDRIPSPDPFGAAVPHSIKPPWFEIQPGTWMVCGYQFFGIPWMVDCETVEVNAGGRP